MKRIILLASLLFLITGCGHDPETGRRFEAERELWNTNQEMQRLAIRPDLVQPDQWEALARRYESIPEAHRKRQDTPAGTDIDRVAARALISAAEIYRIVGDSAKMEASYLRVEEEYSNISSISAEAALARGRIAERRGQTDGAIASYETVLGLVEPNSAQPGIRSIVLELPLRNARLAARGIEEDPAGLRALYEPPASYYSHWAEEGPNDLTRIDARIFLADVAADIQDWKTAVRELRKLENELAPMDSPPKDPAALCFALANSMLRGGAPEESSLVAFATVVERYPDSPMAARALFALAEINNRNGRTEETLAHLRRIREGFDDDEVLASRSLLLEGQVLEADGRWPEAHDIFRSLPVQHPLSEAALLAPLEIVKHYARVGDTEGENAALERAGTTYREFISRYPSGRPTFVAREKLAEVLARQSRYEEAMDEFLQLAESQRTSVQGAKYLISAASIAYNSSKDTLRAAEILDLAASRYATQPVGKWAEGEAARLRGGDTQ